MGSLVCTRRQPKRDSALKLLVCAFTEALRHEDRQAAHGLNGVWTEQLAQLLEYVLLFEGGVDASKDNFENGGRSARRDTATAEGD